MASEVSGQTTTVTTEGGEAVATNPAPVKGEWKVRGHEDNADRHRPLLARCYL